MEDLTKEQIEEIRATGLLAGTFDKLCDMAVAKKEAEERAAEAEREVIKLETKYKQQVKETYRQWVSGMEWRRNAQNSSSVFCTAHQYMVESDGEDGGVRNKHRQCPFCESAELHGEKRKLEENHKQLRRMMINAGMCPDCGEIPVMDEEGPFSHCGCGTQEDYGTRPAQAMQLKLKKQEPSNADAIQALDYLLDVVEQYYLSPNTEVAGSYEERFKVWVRLAREKYITIKRALDNSGALSENQDSGIPNINVRYVISDGLVKGDTFLNVFEIQREDDGSLTVVTSQ